MKINETVSIGIINWNSRDFLNKCIDSILNQTYKNIELLFVDNASSDSSVEFVQSNYKNDSRVRIIETGSNLGYSEGANIAIRESKGEYILIMNPDVVLDENCILNLYKEIIIDERIGAISPKILRYDFENNKKMNIFDSAGLVMQRTRRCTDRGQNEIDEGQYNKKERIFGVCGAAAFYRKSILEEVKIENEYFDRDFFAYKEDVDLALRINLYGFKCIYAPLAIAYHGRVFGGCNNGFREYLKNRKKQSKFVKQLSFRNHYLMLIKNKTRYSNKKDYMQILNWNIKFIVYSLLFEQYNLIMFKDIFKLKNKMKKKNYIINNNLCDLNKEYHKFIK